MAALRGARDVESLLWFDKYCRKGLCVNEQGEVHTNMMVLYVCKDQETSSMSHVVRGFEHLLMICGVAYYGFPLKAKGNSLVQAFPKHTLNDEDEEFVHPCLSSMCRGYKEFMLENVRKLVEGKKRVTTFMEEVVEDEDMLQLFMSTSVMICALSEKTKECRGHDVTILSVKQVLEKVWTEQWCYDGVDKIDYSSWNLHLNLCYAWSSFEVEELVDTAHDVVVPDTNKQKFKYKDFSEMIIKFCNFVYDGKTVGMLLNDHLNTHVKKCRKSFFDSKYEERIRLIYCMVWHIIYAEADIMAQSVEYLFENVFGSDIKFSKCFVDMYNAYGDQGFVTITKQTRRVVTKRASSASAGEESDTCIKKARQDAGSSASTGDEWDKIPEGLFPKEEEIQSVHNGHTEVPKITKVTQSDETLCEKFLIEGDC